MLRVALAPVSSCAPSAVNTVPYFTVYLKDCPLVLATASVRTCVAGLGVAVGVAEGVGLAAQDAVAKAVHASTASPVTARRRLITDFLRGFATDAAESRCCRQSVLVEEADGSTDGGGQSFELSRI